MIDGAMIDGALRRLKDKVLSANFDWAYVECNTDPGEPDMKDDVKVVCVALESFLDSSSDRDGNK